MMPEESENKTNRPAWQAEITNPELCEKLREGLKEIVDPEIGLNIIQLGLVRDVTIQENRVVVKMILTTPFCPYGPAMLENTREKAAQALENMEVALDFSVEPWDFSMMDEDSSANWGPWGIF
jgi:metal-sulfur cluster biosynthetic enzyme